LGILQFVEDAYAEIASVFALIDAIELLTVYPALANQYTGGQFLVAMIFDFFIVPILPTLIIGWIARWLGISRLIQRLIAQG